MSRLALAAQQGGAAGIRANTKQDIIAIKEACSLAVIGILKRDYADSDVFITATTSEIEELIDSKCEMIALDATFRARPKGQTIKELIQYAKKLNPNILLMADISTIEEAINAEVLGFDCVSTTLYGYTKETAGKKLFDQDFQFLHDVVQVVNVPVIAEGNVLTPDMSRRCIELGAHSVVVGGAITRPLEITKRFVYEMKNI